MIEEDLSPESPHPAQTIRPGAGEMLRRQVEADRLPQKKLVIGELLRSSRGRSGNFSIASRLAFLSGDPNGPVGFEGDEGGGELSEISKLMASVLS